MELNDFVAVSITNQYGVANYVVGIIFVISVYGAIDDAPLFVILHLYKFKVICPTIRSVNGIRVLAFVKFSENDDIRSDICRWSKKRVREFDNTN